MEGPQIIERGPILIAGAIISCRGVGFENNEALMKESKHVLADSRKRINKEDIDYKTLTEAFLDADDIGT